MAALMALMGVPREALLLEGRSRNTHENAVETLNILQARGVKRILLVTSAMHMPRAYRVFDGQSIEVLPAPTDYRVTDQDWGYYLQINPGVLLLNLLPDTESLHLTTLAIKEYVGLATYWLQGWL
jgi:uncharacterized SAM-binding protein YcdF (DUF218 family)